MTKDATPLPMPQPWDYSPNEPPKPVNATAFTFVGQTCALRMLHADLFDVDAAKPGEPVHAAITGKFEFNARTLLHLLIGAVSMSRMAVERGLLTSEELEHALNADKTWTVRKGIEVT